MPCRKLQDVQQTETPHFLPSADFHQVISRQKSRTPAGGALANELVALDQEVWHPPGNWSRFYSDLDVREVSINRKARYGRKDAALGGTTSHVFRRRPRASLGASHSSPTAARRQDESCSSRPFFFLGLRRPRLWVVSGTERPTRPSAGALQPRTLARPSRLHTAVPTRGSCCIQTEVRPQTAHPDGGRYAGPRPHRGV